MARIKLVLLGGGGVRAPLFVSSALRRAERIGIDELCLMDIDERKLRVFGALCREIARAAGSPVRITATGDPHEALEGAAYVVTTIRVGGEHGRVLDERIALRHGVLGQETTGPGGFAMALRSIPAILGYAELLERLNPQAWIFNFTNPASLVVQALRDQGFQRTIGICDSANLAQHAVAGWLGMDPARLRAEVFGLNHLSWARRVLLDGNDALAPLLKDPAFVAGTMLRLFDYDLVQRIGLWLNEYLYYYYYAERALAGILADRQTRGEEVEALNRALLDQLEPLVATDPRAALAAYTAYNDRRGATYMHYAKPTSAPPAPSAPPARPPQAQPATEPVLGEGYAGVALSLMEAIESGTPLYTALNVPNAGAIAGMRPDDVVEVSCVVDRDGAHPLPIGPIPEDQELLMRAVKRYERLAVQAIRERSIATAQAALMAHPLVLSYSRAQVLVDEYLAAHAPYTGTWR